MLDHMAFKSATDNNRRYDKDPPVIATWGDAPDFYRRRFVKEKNQRRLAEAAAKALAEAANDLDSAAKRDADAAIQEAITTVSGVDFDQMPWIGVSDESIVTLQWERGDVGMVLIFSGDGVFALSPKSGSGEHYTREYREQKTAEGLPSAVHAEIIRLSQSGASPTGA
jgi:hypothetical protein